MMIPETNSQFALENPCLENTNSCRNHAWKIYLVKKKKRVLTPKIKQKKSVEDDFFVVHQPEV